MSGNPEGSGRYLYQIASLALQFINIILIIVVHPSYKSDTGIRIIRRLPPRPPVHSPSPHPENPYVFKPKSYSRKAYLREPSSSPNPTPPPSKKFKFNPSHPPKCLVLNRLDKKYLLAQLAEAKEKCFTWAIRGKQKMQEEVAFQLPLKMGTPSKKNLNVQLSHRIEIVSTNNEKILIPVHQGLLKANTNHSKNEQNLEGIVNPFNSELKKHFSEKIDFARDYKSGYTPIQLQDKSNKQEQKAEECKKERAEECKKERAEECKKEKNDAKAHFIKKKQSTLSLSRTCGVSYIKPSESKQTGPFDNLPPLIFQCSTSCNYSPELRQLYQTQVEKLIHLSQSRWLPGILTNQEHMRDLLLGKPFGRAIWVYGLQNIWPLLNEGMFLLVLFDREFASTEEQVWGQFHSSYFKFGVLAKKSTSGRKLFMKSIQSDSFDKGETTFPDNIDQNTNKSTIIPQKEPRAESQGAQMDAFDADKSESKQVEEKTMKGPSFEEKRKCKDIYDQLFNELKNSRTVVTMSLKLEMYVEQLFWKGQCRQGKNLLNAIIHSFQENLQKKSLLIIRDRLELLNKDKRAELIRKSLRNIRFGSSLEHLYRHPRYQPEGAIRFSLQTLGELNSHLEGRELIMEREQVAAAELLKDKEGRENISAWEKSLKMPIYYISTRDSFAFDLVEKVTLLERNGRPFRKIQYFFEGDNFPDNFGEYRKLFPGLETGVVCYHDFFSEEELQHFEAQTLQTQRSAFKNKFLQMTVQPTIIGNRIKRTKFFFGYRYMWTRCQLAEQSSYVGAGVRRDVTEAPRWLKQVEQPMVDHNIVEANFLNSVALNVYHDGSEGLAQHFDDAVRFRQPIYTLRLVSDGRLSFGSQFYGFCNGAFIIPLPRGCICVMNENSYAANGVKHCVRPCDMSGKSAAIIMRQMHHQVVKEAAKYDEFIDLPAWLSCISEHPSALTFAEQKRRESQQILNRDQAKREKLTKAVPADL